MLFSKALVSTFVASFSLLESALAASTHKSRWSVHEKRDAIPSSFVESGVAPLDQVISMRINLVMGDQAGLEDALEKASNPTSPTFRQWLSKEQVEAFSAPSSDSVQAVTDWLSSFSITPSSLTPAGDWLSFDVPVSVANQMLNTQFSVFTHVASGKTSLQTLEFSLPEEVQAHILTVHPTTSFPGTVRHLPVTAFKEITDDSVTTDVTPVSDATVPASCNTTITPACLQALYNIPTTPAHAGTNSTLGVAAFDDQNANMADLKQFLTMLRPDMNPNTSFAFTSVDGGQNVQTLKQAGVEADLDIQYTVGLATGIPVTFVDVGENTQDGDDDGFLDIINALLAEENPPLVFTTSYGFDTEASLSESLTVAMCNSYMQLTSRGVSILFASGDGGVASTPGVECSTMFPPTFPTCPFATLVGATENVPEKGAALSAGGFSNYFAQPSWQTTAVEAYLDFLGDTYAGMFNRSGRAYPDVSAQGERVEIVEAGRVGTVGGTSCASPIFSSVVALINDDLLAAGKPVLGFLNPWIYAHPEAFNDITTGNNPGCNTLGFFATTGWDPVTGMGSPNFLAMRTAAGI